jgi:hypothetical protein
LPNPKFHGPQLGSDFVFPARLIAGTLAFFSARGVPRGLLVLTQLLLRVKALVANTACVLSHCVLHDFLKSILLLL